MKLRVGYELTYDFPQPTPLIGMLNVHYTRAADLAAPDHILTTPSVPISGYRDLYGNWCSRILAPAGRFTLSTDVIVSDSGLADEIAPGAAQTPVEALPEEAIVFLLPSRFCDSDRLLDLAWTLFGHTKPGWERVQAICDFTHRASPSAKFRARDADRLGSLSGGSGGLPRLRPSGGRICRALNIPARYCTGYLGDVGTPPPYPPGDFAAWFEAGWAAHGAPLIRATTRRALAAF